jgi:hypothetical protein
VSLWSSPYGASAAAAAVTWVDLDLTEAATGQDTNSVINSVTGSGVIVANGASAAGSAADVGCLYWTGADTAITGEGYLFVECELSADVPEAAAIGVGLAIDPDALSTSNSAWCGLKEQASGSNVQGWTKFTGSISSSGGNRTDRTIGIVARTNSNGQVAEFAEYRRDSSGNITGTFNNPSTSMSGAHDTFILAISRSGDAGSNQTIQIAAVRYQFVAAPS